MFRDTKTLLLHAVRIRGMASVQDLAGVTAIGVDALEKLLDDAAAEGLVRHRTGVLTGWSMTPAGRDEHGARTRADLEESGLEPRLALAYEQFLALNESFKAVCTTWQLEDKPPGCVSSVEEIHGALTVVIDELCGIDARFGTYAERFGSALERLKNGDTDALTKPLSGSYHDVWMELHQDLLLTLGRERSAADGH